LGVKVGGNTVMDWFKRLSIAAVAVSLVVLAGCTGPSEGESPSSAVVSDPPATPSAIDVDQSPTLGPKEAAREFLAIVCPTDSALHLVETVSLTAGGWKEVKPKDVRPYAKNAIDAARLASQDLQRDDWPESISKQMPQVAREYLEMLAPLEEINQSATGESMNRPWKRIRSLSRTSEQQVRLTLGLAGVGSQDDGCPPAPKAPKPAASAAPTSPTAPAVPATPTDYRTRLCTTAPGSLPAVGPGESSANVRLLQWALSQLGYYRGAIGGNYGDMTFDATYRFQLDNGLGRTAPGSVAVNTWSWLQFYLC